MLKEALRETFLLLLIGLWPLAVCCGELPRAEVTLRVTNDESGKSVPSAEARISFSVPDGQGGTKVLSRSGLTDAGGKFSAAENALFNITASAHKDGYYPTGVNLDLTPTLSESYGPKTVVPIVLKPVVNPVPMYARRHARLELPAVDRPVRFDLIAYDWLPPHGKGSVADMVFTLSVKSRSTGEPSGVLSLTFSNEGDGIQSLRGNPKEGSALRLPRLGPDTGYQTEWNRETGASYAPIKDQNYCFRVRTVRDGAKIRSALYGKIHGDIQLDTINSKTAVVILSYYLNPDGTRNLEFDPKRNLFRNLKSDEQVRDP